VAIERAWNRRQEQSIVTDLFTMQIITLVTCPSPTCEHSSMTFEENNFLDVDLPGGPWNIFVSVYFLCTVVVSCSDLFSLESQ